MPRYNWNINELLFEEDVRKVYDAGKTEYERAAVALLWTLSPRPAEMMVLTTDKFTITPKKLALRIITLKKKKNGKFFPKERILEIDRPEGMESNIYVETVVRLVAKTQAGQRIIPYTTRWLEKVITRLTMEVMGKPLTPYHFRHSVLTWGSQNGWTEPELKHFKGGGSVAQYVAARPFVVKLQLMRRGLN